MWLNQKGHGNGVIISREEDQQQVSIEIVTLRSLVVCVKFTEQSVIIKI